MTIWGDQIRERADHELRLKIAAVISARTGDYPIRPKRPLRPVPTPPSERPARGVYELEFAPPGRRAFHLVSSDGNVGYVDFPEHWGNLWKRLDREDPPAQLHIIPASASE
jgi:hypothetical protein